MTLPNLAKEHLFKAGEHWTLKRANEEEKTDALQQKTVPNLLKFKAGLIGIFDYNKGQFDRYKRV
ncbi:hypothetical protein ABIB62_002337 [Mucilaginibacter sp. UYP25]|uniref:hypothetical protein n=1 Tax=unclassified Mucilaginibacter TaxID=2617802 RepID=UPI0033988CD9